MKEQKPQIQGRKKTLKTSNCWEPKFQKKNLEDSQRGKHITQRSRTTGWSAWLTGRLTHCWISHLCPQATETEKLMRTSPGVSWFGASLESCTFMVLPPCFWEYQCLGLQQQNGGSPNPGFAGSRMWGVRLGSLSVSGVYVVLSTILVQSSLRWECCFFWFP